MRKGQIRKSHLNFCRNDVGRWLEVSAQQKGNTPNDTLKAGKRTDDEPRGESSPRPSFLRSRPLRKGQIFSSDFAMSLLIFAAASIIAYTIIVNTLDDSSYDDVQAQAIRAASIVVGEGYPTHWTNQTALRIGVQSDHRLSMRKVQQMGTMNTTALRSRLRLTDKFYIYFTNETNETISLFGACGIGDISTPVSLRNQTIPTIALVNQSNNSLWFLINNSLFNLSPATASMVVFNQSSAFADMTALASYDAYVVIGNITYNRTATADEYQLLFNTLANRGNTFFMYGDPGVSILGIVVNTTNATNITVDDSLGASLGLAINETIAVTGPIATINQPSGAMITDVRIIARTNTGKIAIAQWLYADSQVWYVATTNGTLASGTAISYVFANATARQVLVNRPLCSSPSITTAATQVASRERTVLYHDHLLTVHVVVWRER